ncbi:MAG: phosphoribosyltransferase family protein [Chloroflexota bacterium]
MTGESYDYSRREDILPISWEDFHGLCKALALAVEPYAPEIILPVGRGGYYPGTLLAHLLRVEVYPVRLSRRVRDEVMHETPQWLQAPPAAVAGKRVLVVDEISSTGQTLQMVVEKAGEYGAAESRSAVLYAHSWSVDIPDYIGLISDALLLNPWDREVLVDGRFIVHPEYAEALTLQDQQPDASLLIPATPFAIAKGG